MCLYVYMLCVLVPIEDRRWHCHIYQQLGKGSMDPNPETWLATVLPHY